MNNINDNIDTINEISFINTVINEEKTSIRSLFQLIIPHEY
jgi:hypothetical protein